MHRKSQARPDRITCDTAMPGCGNSLQMLRELSYESGRRTRIALPGDVVENAIKITARVI
jgi:hypothetical protein